MHLCTIYIWHYYFGVNIAVSNKLITKHNTLVPCDRSQSRTFGNLLRIPEFL